MHSSTECRGNCSTHPLLIGDALEFHLYVQDGGLWGNYVCFGEMLALESESSVQKERRLEKMAAEEVLKMVAVASVDMKTYAEVMGLKKGKKVMRPCKNLFLDEKASKEAWVKNKKGVLCPPISKTVKSECWAYEYVDPKTKEKKKPHTCPYLHPGEMGW